MKLFKSRYLCYSVLVVGLVFGTVKGDSNLCSNSRTYDLYSMSANSLFAFSVLTWNVNLIVDDFIELNYLRYFEGQNMNNPGKRAELIADKLLLEGFDLIVLEEFIDKDLRAIVQKRFDRAGYYQSEVLGIGYDNWTYLYNGGVVVFSRHPIVAEDERVLPAVGGQRVAAIGVKYVRLKPVYGRAIHVFAVHLQTIQHGSEGEHKNLRWHIDELKRFKAEKKIPKDDIVFFIGDFNVNAGNKSNVIHEQLMENNPHEDFDYLCEQLNVKEVCPYQNSLPFSFNSMINSMAMGKFPLGTLDNIFCGQDHICPVGGNLQIIRFDVDEGSDLELDELSDHYPIKGTLYFQKGTMLKASEHSSIAK